MSRTYRKRGYMPSYIERRFTGDDLIKEIARFHSDAGVGPGWLNSKPKHWRKLFERKDRAYTRNQLSRFLKNEEYEVQLRRKPLIDYYY